MADEQITLGIILEHLRGLETRVLTEIRAITTRMDVHEAESKRINRNLSSQIDTIDRRLDTVEIEHLPKRVTRLEQHCGLATAA